VVDTTLCIPTIFISYTGEALDYKTPLLKALAAVDKAATDVCQLFDKNITRVYTNLGWEQEYFLVDSALYNARPDLCLTGRTLMGHSSAKDQQLEDHYFGSIPPRVTAFMKELEIECHKLGIQVKEMRSTEYISYTEHQSETDKPEQNGTYHKVHQVFHQDVGCVLAAGKSGFYQGKARLHEEYQHGSQ
jgi:glutamine synthetase type III